MKKYTLITAAVLMAVAACKDPKTDDTVVRQRDSLMSVITDRENSVNELMGSFNEVERNLDSVRIHQHLIVENSTGDKSMDRKAYINSQIAAINKLMDENAQKIKTLNRRIGKADKKNAELQKMVETLTNQLNQKYTELAELNTRLANLDAQVAQLQTSVDTLTSQNMAQNQTIADKTTQLHTAYYVVGESKELQKSKLIDKKGGLLGIGRTAKLTDNIDNNMFTKIDYTEVTSIPVNSKDAKIITTHPADSYTLDKTGKTINSIMINNPEKFWSASKYLVVAK